MQLHLSLENSKKLSADRVIYLFIFFLTLLSIINGFIPQMGVFLLKFIPGMYAEVERILLIVTVLLVMRKRLKIVNINLILACLLVVFYLSVTIFINTLRFDLSYSLRGAAVYFMLLPLMFFLVSGSKQVVNLNNLLIIIALVCGSISIVQALTNNPLLITDNAVSGFKVFSWAFYGGGEVRVRGFSFFTSALEAGIFYIFSACIVAAILLNKVKLLNLLIFITIALAIYCTFTRNIYLGFPLALLSTVFISKLRSMYILYAMPLISLFLGFFISFGGSVLNSDSSLYDSYSLNVRWGAWSSFLELLRRNDAVHILFGEGIYQSFDSVSSRSILTDNTFLQIMAYQGIVGLLILIILYSLVLKFTVDNRHHLIMRAFYGLLCAIPAMSMFNNLLSIFLGYTFISIFMRLSGPIAIRGERRG